MRLHGKYRLIRDVTPNECNWLNRTFKKGEIVFESYACTYGCISNDGVSCCLTADNNPFFELPYDAVETIDVKAEAEKKRKKTLESRKKALRYISQLQQPEVRRCILAYIKRLEEIAADELIIMV